MSSECLTLGAPVVTDRQDRRSSLCRRAGATVALCLSLAGPLHAQQGLAFSIDFGYTGVNGGNWANVLDDGIHSEIMVEYVFSSGVLIGAGLYLVSYDLQPGFGENTISNVQPQVALGYSFSMGKIRPYAQLRGVVTRLRLEGNFQPTPPDEEGENTSDQRWGGGGTVAAGLEFAPWRQVTLDLSGWLGAFTTQEVDLTDIGGGVISDGRSSGVQLGIKWYSSP